MPAPAGSRGKSSSTACSSRWGSGDSRPHRRFPGERAIDVGCGCGATTIALAGRVGESGHVLGVDISEPMLARARERCAELRLTNVELMRSDAQQAQLPPAHDLAFSRFGVMFFDDPTAAMANIGRGLEPGGRLVFVCWQDRNRNPWMGIPMAAALQHVPAPPAPDADAPGPFVVRRIPTVSAASSPTRASPTSTIEPVEHELLVGGASDLDGAVSFAADSGSVRSVLGNVDDDTRRRAAESIRAALAPYAVRDGVRLAVRGVGGQRATRRVRERDHPATPAACDGRARRIDRR